MMNEAFLGIEQKIIKTSDERVRCRAMEWIDIKEQMPKSGVPLLIASRNISGKPRILRALYAAPKTISVADLCDDDFGEYDESDDEFYCPEGFYEWNEYDEVHWRVDGEVTHWMPLPAFPGAA